MAAARAVVVPSLLYETFGMVVAEAYAREGRRASADSVYELVAARYPRADRAPTALYKLALSRRAAGEHARARTLLERIVREYPRSDEATFARDQLQTMR